MGRILYLSLVALLLTFYGAKATNLYDDIVMTGEIESWDEEWEEETQVVEEWEEEKVLVEEPYGFFPKIGSEHSGRTLVNVDSFGAVGDGVADDTKAFLSAWSKVCSLPKAVFLVPGGRSYLVNATRFKGPCAERLIVQIAGTIIAPDDPNEWDPKNPRVWLVFSQLTGVRFQGGGTLYGSGKKWWASSCKKNKTNVCRPAPTALTIDSSSVIRVKNINLKDSQQMHFTISRSNGVRVLGVRIEAPSDSPNTDGIHISDSTNVVLQNCNIGTGDDCISVSNGTSNIKMKNIQCGPGHGISIGSLGKDNTTAAVADVFLNTATLRNTTNGLRIKTWQGGSGYVRAVRFENVKMIDVANPIIIDQFYCDSPSSCQNQTSAVKISDVMYRNISGTSKTAKAMKFACSDSVPCSSIVLTDIKLERNDGPAETFCNCAMGFNHGVVQPAADCLHYNTCAQVKTQTQNYNTYHSEL